VTPPTVPRPWPAAATVLVALMIAYGLAWEALIAPLREGSLLWLKVLPLALFLPGLWRGRLRSFQAMSLLIWLYVCEALVRVAGLSLTEMLLAWGWLGLSMLECGAVFMGVRASRRALSKAVTGESPSQI